MLAVRLGDRAARVLYTGLVVASGLVVVAPCAVLGSWFTLLALPRLRAPLAGPDRAAVGGHGA